MSPLPTFLIVGAARAGTTSLWRYCAEHPDIFMSPVKECCFFSYGDPAVASADRPARVVVRTLDEYRRLFEAARDEKAIGEASPQYLASPAAPERIRATLPEARIVVSLRHPVDRAYSGYLMHLREGRASPDVRSAFEGAPMYVRNSFYAARLAQYYETFGRDRIKVLLFDDLKRNPSGTMADLFRFLGVDPAFLPDVGTRHNPGSAPRSLRLHALVVRPLSRIARAIPRHAWLRKLERRWLYRPAPSMPDDLREGLGRLYRDDTLRVQALIGRDLSGWLRPGHEQTDRQSSS